MVSQTFIDDIQELLDTRSFGTNKYHLVQSICKKYGISQEAVYHRIRSYYGKNLKEIRTERSEPTSQELLKLVQESNDSSEVRAKMPHMSNKQFSGIYERILGVATFHKAKLLTVTFDSTSYVKSYNPSVKDNLALLAATRLGDGHMPIRSGHAGIRIEHCAKQREWLQAKINMFNKSFPWTHSKITHHTKRDTYSWWGGTFSDGKYNEFVSLPKIDMVDHLSPFGIWLLFLDDGSYISSGTPSIYFAVENRLIGDKLIDHLKTYGYTFTSQNDNCIAIKQEYFIKKFLFEFGETFRYLTPECMHYKINCDI